MLRILTCPLCGGGFEVVAGTLRCARGHSFDVARHGYANLLPGGARPGTADTAEMVEARAAFLAAGHYAPVADLLADLAVDAVRAPDHRAEPRDAARSAAKTAEARSSAADPPTATVLDAGAGTGYYLRAVLDECDRAACATPPVGMAVDISTRALRRAARAHPRIGAVACDLWAPLPVRPATVALIVNVFAPRNGAQFRRVLRGDGKLLVVTPGPRHLRELVRDLGLVTVDERKPLRLAASLDEHFALADRVTRTVDMRLSHVEAQTLVAMGPSARHQDRAATRSRLAELGEPVTVTGQFHISTYRPR